MDIAKVYIKGQIGSTYNPETGEVVEKGVELAEVILMVNANLEAEILEIWIDSPGGDVIIGRAIRDYIASLKNAWTVAGDFCASAATEIALAVPLERRKKVAGGKYIIHNPWMSVAGDATVLHEAADFVAEAEAEMLNMYHKATGLDKAALKGLMALETSLTDEQLTEFKFVSQIIPKAELKALAFMPHKKVNFNKAEMEKTIAKIVGSKFDEFKKSIGIKVAAKAPVKKIVKAEKATDVKAEVLEADNDVKIYTDIPLADFVADPTKECKVFSDEAMATPMADGSYTLKDGSKLTVAGGLVTEYEQAEVEASADGDDSAEVVALRARVAELEAEQTGIEERLRGEFEAELDTQLNAIKAEIGSNYTPKAAATTTSATRQTTTVVAKKDKDKDGLSMKERAAQRRGEYKK